MATPTTQNVDRPDAKAVFRFQGADLSTDDVTLWVPVPTWATRACLYLGCTSTGSPVGVLSLKQASNPAADVVAADTHTRPVWQPTGAAYVLTLDTIEIGGGALALYWDVTSGGTGAVWTDETGVAGTFPTITFVG